MVITSLQLCEEQLLIDKFVLELIITTIAVKSGQNWELIQILLCLFSADTLDFAVPNSSLFQLTLLTYTEKFEIESPVIMQEKQCNQMEQFSAMAKESDCFLSLDDKS